MRKNNVYGTFPLTLFILLPVFLAILWAPRIVGKVDPLARWQLQLFYQQFGKLARIQRLTNTCLKGYQPTGDNPCPYMVSCILGLNDKGFKAAMSGVAVFLGFTPTMLILISPRMSDLGLLAMERPVLSTLCSWGTSGYYFEQTFVTFSAQSSIQCLRDSSNNSIIADESFFLKKVNWCLISAIQYIIAVAAAVNTVHNTYQVRASHPNKPSKKLMPFSFQR
jgi:hypothetical protein